MKPTRIGRETPYRLGVVRKAIGTDPDLPTGDVPDPVDYLDDEVARVWYPVQGGGTTDLLQSGAITASGAAASNMTVTLGADVTAGSLLVALLLRRSSNYAWGVPSGWTKLTNVYAPNGGNGYAGFAYKVANGTEGAAFTFDTGETSSDRRLVVAELSGPNAFIDSAETTSASSGTSHVTGAVTPTLGAATTMIAAGIQSDGDTPSIAAPSSVTGYTIINAGAVHGGLSPRAILAYKATTGAGSETATVNSAIGGNGWASYLVAFSDISDPVWISTPFVNDGDDATYIEVDGLEECLRVQLVDEYRIGSARLRIACETAGAKSYVLQGQTVADIEADTGTTIGTFAFTATGSFTADDVEITIDDADGYEFYRLVGPDETRRFHALELYPPSGSGEEPTADAHIADTSDAHGASAVSLADAAGWFAAGNMEGGLAELAAKAIGYQAHGNLGATETFDAATGWHSGTLDAACTFTLTAAPTGTVSSLFLELAQDGTGGRAITLPASVVNKADLEAAQDTTAGATTMLVLLSRDGGTTWYGGWWGTSGGGAPTGAAGGDLSGTYPNPSVVDDSHSHTAATLPASSGSGGPLLISDDHSTPILFADLLLTEEGDDLLYADSW